MYYDPTLQRFISEDPIGFASGDFNWYRYVGDSPVNFVDPKGLYGPGTFDQECHDKCLEEVFLLGGCSGDCDVKYFKCYNKCIEDKFDNSTNECNIHLKSPPWYYYLIIPLTLLGSLLAA